MKRRGVFLGLGGTLVERTPEGVPPQPLTLAEGADRALADLAAAGYGLAVVSRQPGVARGLIKEAVLEDVGEQLASLARGVGAGLLGFWYCPHLPDAQLARYRAGCTCRMPAPGLLLRAAQSGGIDLAASWLIADTLDDVEAGRRVGCHTILLDNGGETEWREGAQRHPHYVVKDIAAAARAVVARTPQPPRTAAV